MRILRGHGTNGLLLAACLGLAGSVHAACNGPQGLVAQLRARPSTEIAVKLGSWYAEHRQFDCAVEALQVGLKTDPNSAQVHYLVGLALIEGKHSDESISELQKSIQLAPDEAPPRLLLASVYEKTGKHAEAEGEWKQALRIDPKSEIALEGLATDLIARKDYVDAVKLLHSAARTEKLTIKLAQALGLLNYLDEAAAVLNQAMQANPDSQPLANAMTVVLVKQGKYQDAINLLQKTVDAHPGDLDAALQLFRLLVLTNHINQARPLGPKLLAERPKDSEVLYLNGIVQRSIGDYAMAKTFLEQAVAIDPNFYNSRYNLGMVLVFLHEWQEAKENLQKAIDLGATQSEVHFELAKALHGLGDTEHATEEMKKYQQMKKDEETVLEAAEAAALGDKELEDGKIKEALGHYHDAADGQPANANYRYKLAIAMNRAGDATGEREQLEQAVKLDPKLAGAQNALGYLLSRGGEVDGSVEHFKMAVDAAPGWTEAWINLAAELAVGSHFNEARQAVSKALEIDPGNVQAKQLSDQLAKDPGAQQEHP